MQFKSKLFFSDICYFETGIVIFQSDIYSCGMILLELVMPPFKTTSERIEVLGKLRKDGSVPKIIKQNHPQWVILGFTV
jgi:hypothetical protein